MPTVSEMIDLIWRPPRKEPGVKRPSIDRKLPENFKYYGNWGFAIYRTYYNPESDKHWDMLLDALKRQTYLALSYFEDEDRYRDDVEQRAYRRGRGMYQTLDEYMDDLKRLKERFHLDPREDLSLLDGLDVRQLREVCLSQHPEAEKTMAGGRFRFVLVADEAVLKDIAKGEFVVKAVAYDWREGGGEWDNPHRILRFDGPEEDLEEYTWPGGNAAPATSCCSEIRHGLVHYSAQRPLFKVERNKE